MTFATHFKPAFANFWLVNFCVKIAINLVFRQFHFQFLKDRRWKKKPSVFGFVSSASTQWNSVFGGIGRLSIHWTKSRLTAWIRKIVNSFLFYGVPGKVRMQRSMINFAVYFENVKTRIGEGSAWRRAPIYSAVLVHWCFQFPFHVHWIDRNVWSHNPRPPPQHHHPFLVSYA